MVLLIKKIHELYLGILETNSESLPIIIFINCLTLSIKNDGSLKFNFNFILIGKIN